MDCDLWIDFGLGHSPPMGGMQGVLVENVFFFFFFLMSFRGTLAYCLYDGVLAVVVCPRVAWCCLPISSLFVLVGSGRNVCRRGDIGCFYLRLIYLRAKKNKKEVIPSHCTPYHFDISAN